MAQSQSKRARRQGSRTRLSNPLEAALDAPAPAAAAPPEQAPAPGGKLGLLVGLMRRPEGARIDEMMTATGWQAHSVRGALSGALKRNRGLVATSAMTSEGRVYRLPTPAVAAPRRATSARKADA